MRITSTHGYDLPVPAGALWADLERIDLYRSWWPWLRELAGSALAAGGRGTCAIRPPLPYLVHICVDLREVVRPQRVVADISGDLSGWARLEIVPAGAGAGGEGCRAELTSSLAPRRGVLRV